MLENFLAQCLAPRMWAINVSLLPFFPLLIEKVSSPNSISFMQNCIYFARPSCKYLAEHK